MAASLFIFTNPKIITLLSWPVQNHCWVIPLTQCKFWPVGIRRLVFLEQKCNLPPEFDLFSEFKVQFIMPCIFSAISPPVTLTIPSTSNGIESVYSCYYGVHPDITLKCIDWCLSWQLLQLQDNNVVNKLSRVLKHNCWFAKYRFF